MTEQSYCKNKTVQFFCLTLYFSLVHFQHFTMINVLVDRFGQILMSVVCVLTC